MSTTATGLRERKKERTRRAIADVALDLFESRGYGQTTVDDIAAAADVSPRTFFRYFASKDEAVFERADDVREAFTALLSSRPDDEPLLVSLREIGNALISRELVDEARLRRLLVLIQAEPALRSRYNHLIDLIESELTVWAADRLGAAPTDLRPRLVAAAVLAARRVATDTWLESPGEDLADHMARAIDLLAAGLTDG
ncbi:MAG: TetR family transcriptional regulator [Acidimicrobiales bacterium]|nr:TetR family transcriptional regulator [Acidimicrobiales bacterium]